MSRRFGSYCWRRCASLLSPTDSIEFSSNSVYIYRPCLPDFPPLVGSQHFAVRYRCGMECNQIFRRRGYLIFDLFITHMIDIFLFRNRNLHYGPRWRYGCGFLTYCHFRSQHSNRFRVAQLSGEIARVITSADNLYFLVSDVVRNSRPATVVVVATFVSLMASK